MAQKIGADDFFDPSFFDSVIRANKELTELLKTFTKMAKKAKEVSQGIKMAKSFNELQRAADRAGSSVRGLTQEERELKRITDQVERETRKASNALTKEGIALAKAREQTRRANAEARRLAKAQLGATKSTNKWSKALGSFQFKFNALGNIASNVVSSLTRYFKGFVTSGIKAYDTQIKAETQLLTAMNGRISAQQRLLKQAGELQKVTLYGDEETIRAQALIAAFVDEEEAIKRVIPLVQDMATAKGMDLAGAADLVSKTLGSSTNALSRYGIQVEGAVGSTERLESLVKGLNDAFGGQAKAAAEADITLTRLKNAFGDVKEGVIGSAQANNIFGRTLTKVTAKIENIAKQWRAIGDPRQSNAMFILSQATGDTAESVAKLEEENAKLNERLNSGERIKRKDRKELEKLNLAQKDALEILRAQVKEQKEKPVVEEVETIGTLKEELSELQTLRDNVTIDQVANINKEIVKLREQIKEYENLGIAVEESVKKEVLPAIKQVTDMIADPGLDPDDFSWFTDEIANSIVDDARNFNDELISITEERFKKEEELARESAERQNEIRKKQNMEVMQMAGNLASETLNIVSVFQERELQEIERKAAAGLMTEERAAKKKGEILRKQAAADKAAALINIAINTAVAAMKVAGQTGVGAAVAVPLIVALGAAQAAAVLAQPIPQYEKGTDFAKGGPSIVSEKGPELAIEPGGRAYLTPRIPSLVDVKRGTEIVPADITKSLLGYAAVRTAAPNLKDQEVDKLLTEIKGMRGDLRRKPVASATMTPGGILTATHSGNTTIRKLDKYYK